MMRKTRARAILAVASLAGVLALGSPARAHHYRPIQPGARIDVPGGTCTMNFIFQDGAGDLYAGTAGHCFSNAPVGTRVGAAEVGEFGTVVYGEFLSDPLYWMDFGLARIDADKHHLVDPSMRAYTGPTAVQAAFVPGTPTFIYGHGAFLRTTEATRHHPGVLEYVKDDPNWYPTPGWYFATNVVYAGDSGGPVLTGDGKALGIVALISFDDKALVGGPTVERILEWMAERGWDLELVTAPYDPAVALQNLTSGTVEHCLDNPTGSSANPDACVVPPV